MVALTRAVIALTRAVVALTRATTALRIFSVRLVYQWTKTCYANSCNKLYDVHIFLAYMLLQYFFVEYFLPISLCCCEKSLLCYVIQKIQWGTLIIGVLITTCLCVLKVISSYKMSQSETK